MGILHSVRNTELHGDLKNINNTAKMVADSLIYHPSVAHYLKYVATTVGRDKLLRTIQYFSRFYAWYLYRTNGTPGEIAPFEGIRKSPMTQRLAKEAYRCWMFGLLFSAVSGTYSLYNLRQQQKRISKEDGEGVVAAKRIEKERAAINLQLLS